MRIFRNRPSDGHGRVVLAASLAHFRVSGRESPLADQVFGITVNMRGFLRGDCRVVLTLRLSQVNESIVGSGEKVLYVGKVSYLSILPALIGGTLLVLIGVAIAIGAPPIGLIVMLIGAIWLIAGVIRRTSTELAVTNRRVIAKFGLVRRSTVELNLSKVESIRVEQGILGRIFDYGSIIVTGTGSTMEPIPFISKPIAFRQAVQEATNSRQQAS